MCVCVCAFFDICACIGVVMYLCSYSFAVTHFYPRIHHRHTHTYTLALTLTMTLAHSHMTDITAYKIYSRTESMTALHAHRHIHTYKHIYIYIGTGRYHSFSKIDAMYIMNVHICLCV